MAGQKEGNLLGHKKRTIFQLGSVCQLCGQASAAVARSANLGGLAPVSLATVLVAAEPHLVQVVNLLAGDGVVPVCV